MLPFGITTLFTPSRISLIRAWIVILSELDTRMEAQYQTSK